MTVATIQTSPFNEKVRLGSAAPQLLNGASKWHRQVERALGWSWRNCRRTVSFLKDLPSCYYEIALTRDTCCLGCY